MKYKKTIITTLILTSMNLMASDFYVFVKKNKNYEIKKSLDEIIEEPKIFNSCSAILLDDPLKESGYYTVNVNETESTEVYCNMETDSGGWTLVTRLNTTDANTRKWNDTFWTDTNEVGDLYNNNDYSSYFKNSTEIFKSVLLEFNYNNGVLIAEFNNNNNTLNFYDSITQTLSLNNLNFSRIFTNNTDSSNFFGNILSFQVTDGASNDLFRIWYNKTSKATCNQTGAIGTYSDVNSSFIDTWWTEAGYPSTYNECQENIYRSYLGTNKGGSHGVINEPSMENLIGNADFYTTDIINIYIK